MKRSDIKRVLAFAAAFAALVCAGCSETANSSSEKNTETSANSVSIDSSDMQIQAEDLDVGYEEADSTSITFEDESAQISGSGASAEGGIVTISQAGTFILSGSVTNGRVIVDVDKEAEVKLVLNGVSITCEDNAPLLVSSADKVFIILEDGTENTFTDGETYNISEDENTDGAIFSKADLTINGSGKLTVNASYKHGIVSKDDLVITGGSIEVTSASTALEGKDSVKICDGTFEISAGTNAIKSTNTEDETKGYISITGGTFNIVANGDGLDAETVLSVEAGEFNITTGGGSSNASMNSDGTVNEDWQNDMHSGGGGMKMDGGMGRMNSDMSGEIPDDVPQDFSTDGGFMQDGVQMTAADGEYTLELTANVNTLSDEIEAVSTDSESTSAKGLKVGGSLLISGGTFNIDSADDSIHCNGDGTISGGTITASSGDDGIHVDSNLVISDGTITIEKSYEGIEGMTVTISGGTIDVTASDDGINCAGGSDTGSTDRMGMDQFASESGVFLNITGGTIYVDAGGDGLDSNADLYMEGGTVYVSGPENSGNGALDYNGDAQISGGTIIACGAVGMEECFGENSTQCVVLHDFSSTFSSGTEFTVTDSDGNVILSFTNEKTWQGVVFSSPDLKEGETYTVSAGGESEEITLESIVTSNSSGSMMGGGGMQGGGARAF